MPGYDSQGRQTGGMPVGTSDISALVAAASDVSTAAGDLATSATAVTAAGNAVAAGAGAVNTTTVASEADTVVSDAAGRIGNVLVTAAGTGSGDPVLLYDNASEASGTVVGTVPADAAVGAVYDIDMPVANGIFCKQVTDGPALTISYS